MSWNLLHGSGADADDVVRLIEAHDPDLVLMQEAGPRLDMLTARLGGNYQRSQMTHRRHGPAAWSRHAFEDLHTVALPRATRLDLPVPVFRTLADRVALVVQVRTICFASRKGDAK